jgi:hypothetical protein
MNITKREFLVQMGLAKPGRGRLSREAKVALAEARKQGAVFSDDDAVNAAPKQQEAVNEKPRKLKSKLRLSTHLCQPMKSCGTIVSDIILTRLVRRMFARHSSTAAAVLRI